MLFSEIWLKSGLLRSINDMWYINATPIQEQVIALALSGKNIVWQSQTWTGKTVAFLIPILNKVDTNNRSLQVLILAPTRELVTQIWDEIRSLTKFYGVTSVCLYGGASVNVQKQNLKRKPSIIVSTTGRLMDFVGQWEVNLSWVKYFVLDEVDMMLDMWFVRDIKKIWAQMKDVKQTFTFSATMNNDMKTIIKEHITEYEFIKIGDAVTVDKINHRYLAVDHEHKLSNLIKLIQTHSREKVIIFTHTKRNTKTIHDILMKNRFNAGMLNGNMSQNKRQWTLDDFKKGKLQVLVTTDVAARWLNMENVWLVINFDVPIDAKSYVHRIGRTGRAGAYGKAIMLVSPLEWPLVKEIEKMHRISIKKSEHIVVHDKEWTFEKIRLNRSTDKKWGRSPRNANSSSNKKRDFRPNNKNDRENLDKKDEFKSEWQKKYPPRRDSQLQEWYGPKKFHSKPRRNDNDGNRSQNSRGSRGRVR
jgi:ATP-dependent RNA helicase DeaD